MPVQAGQFIALRDDELVAASDSANAVLVEALLKGDDISGCHVTLYWGSDIQEADAVDAASFLTADGRDVEVEVHYGGQPFYHYIASLE